MPVSLAAVARTGEKAIKEQMGGEWEHEQRSVRAGRENWDEADA